VYVRKQEGRKDKKERKKEYINKYTQIYEIIKK
jgi:hypothetical protein